MLKYLALGLLPVFWAIPGAYLYAACMVFAEQKIYVLPALAASLLFGFGIEWVYLPLIILWLA